MKIIVYCKGASITYQTITERPGPRDSTLHDTTDFLPEMIYLKEHFPQIKTPVYFSSPSYSMLRF